MDDSPDIEAVVSYFRTLQDHLCALFEAEDAVARFRQDTWERPEGGGGQTRVLAEGGLFEQVGINFSDVRGAQLPAAATARRPELAGCAFRAVGLSLVAHARNPYVPTSHANLRFFLARKENGEARWWFGGGLDLTPCYGFEEDCVHWHRVAREACSAFGPDVHPRFKRWCDEYFFLKHRAEPRGIGGLFFDDLDEWGFARCFEFVRSVGDHYEAAYLPIVRRRRQTPYGEREREFQLYRRGRYVEFNLVYDRGTLFGLQSGGRTESILMSPPPPGALGLRLAPSPRHARSAPLRAIPPPARLARQDVKLPHASLNPLAQLRHRMETLSSPAKVPFPQDLRNTPKRVQMPSRFPLVLGLFLLGACIAARHASAASPGLALPTESDLSRNPALAPGWASRLMANDPKLRATAEAALVQGAVRSLPLLRRFLDGRNEDLHLETFAVIRRIGREAIPLLADLLQHGRTSIRRGAVDVLIDLAPDTDRIQPAMRRALGDADSQVARDAARALGALGHRAGPSVPALVKALSHSEPHVRLYAAEALASIGPKAAHATKDLARAVGDPIPGVRWAACEALASIGPAAQPAVPQLIEALHDEFLYVRICAAGALGSIGPKAERALEPLRAAASDPTLHNEAEWALSRIAGIETGEHVVSVPVPAVPVAPQLRPAPPQTNNPPVDWDTTTGRNVVWSVELGNETFGRPVVAGETVYVGTDNARRLNPACQEECGVLMAFRATDGTFLWQDVVPRVERGLREFLLPSTTSAPHVEGNRLYYVTAECQLRCLDTQGFRDGQNNGPCQDEAFQDNAAADIVWQLDMCARLGVFPHEASNSEVLPVGDLLMVCTSNGRNEGHTRVPSPRAPSLIAVDKRSGEVVWRAIGPGEHVLHGQWSSPTAADVNGRMEVLFGGGDGWLRAYEAASGGELWRFDGNPKDARWLPRPGVLSRSSIIASPLFADGRVFLALGQDPLHGNGPSSIHAISPNGRGDVTGSRLLWTSREVGRVVGTPAAKDGLLYVGDLGGTLHCLDAATGAHVWKHEMHGAIWGCLLLAGGRLYVGTIEGGMTVLRAGRQKQVLAQIEMDAPLYSRPALVGNALYLATANRLYLIAEGERGSQ